jgi:PBSX family phage terminase large subunit
VATVAPLQGKGLESVRLATGALNIWEGSVRSSKTVSSLLAWLAFVRLGPAGNLLMVGKTERTLQRNIIDPLVEWLGPSRCRMVAGSGELWICGRRVYLAGANDEKAQEKIRGLTLVGAYVDEVSLMPESMWTMLLTRLSVDGARLYGTTNPDNPQHWLLRDYLSRAGVWLTGDGQLVRQDGPDTLDLVRMSFRLDDNPTLSATYIDRMKREFVGLWYRRFILGEWVVAEGAVYDMWDPARHVISELPPIERWLGCGIDYGTSNPFAALLLGVTRMDGDGRRRLVLTNEWRYDSRRQRRQLSDPEYSERFRGWLRGIQVPGMDLGARPPWTFVDPSAASFVLQLYRDQHPGTAHAVNDVQLGLQLTSGLLARGDLVVHESCKGWCDEVPAYCWDPKAQQLGIDKPIKVADHSLDAGRYVIASTEDTWRALLAA